MAVGKSMNRAQPSARYSAEGWFNMHFGETKLGKFGETISEKVLETAVFRQKVGKNDDFLRSQFASDSVIRWFESSYPSHGYHILYKECASEYNIWFLFYLRLFSPF